MAEKQIERIATVERIMYPKEGHGFCILKTDMGTCKGNLPWRPRDGERLRLTGCDSVYQGSPEFKFNSAIPDVPEDEYAEFSYACSLTKGIGEATRDKIWEALDKQDYWQTEIKRCFDSFEYPGANEKIYTALSETIEYLRVNKEMTRAKVFLLNLGCSQSIADKAWERWNTETIGVVSGNVFALADLPMVGFIRIDNGVRQILGIEDDSPLRIKAAIKYAMSDLTQGMGDTSVRLTLIIGKVNEITKGIGDELFRRDFDDLIKCGFIHDHGNGHFSLGSHYQHEHLIWEFMSYAAG